MLSVSIPIFLTHSYQASAYRHLPSPPLLISLMIFTLQTQLPLFFTLFSCSFTSHLMYSVNPASSNTFFTWVYLFFFLLPHWIAFLVFSTGSSPSSKPVKVSSTFGYFLPFSIYIHFLVTSFSFMASNTTYIRTPLKFNSLGPHLSLKVRTQSSNCSLISPHTTEGGVTHILVFLE